MPINFDPKRAGQSMFRRGFSHPGMFQQGSPASGTVPQQQQQYMQSGLFGRGMGQGSAPNMGMNQRSLGSGGGIIGAPDLGTISELLRFQRQGGQLPPGMQPEVYSGGPTNANGTGMYQATNALGLGQKSEYSGGGTPAYGVQGLQGIQGQPGQGPLNYSREQSPFEMQLQNAIGGMISGKGNAMLAGRMKSEASGNAAGMQQIAEQRAREDAVRRGASSSAMGDADIRDQLNRISAEGARNQQQASLDVDKYFQNQKMGAIGQGNQLLGQQLGDVRSLREMIALIESLKQQQGNTSLGFLFGT